MSHEGRTFKVYGRLTLSGVDFPGYWRTGLTERDVIKLRSQQRDTVTKLSDGKVSKTHSGFGRAFKAHHGHFPAYRDGYSFTIGGKASSFAFWIVEE